MAPQQISCRWAALSLSTIAGTFLPDIQQKGSASENVVHNLVAISTTGTRDRAVSWLKDNKIKNADSIIIYHDWKEMLERGDFDVVYISTPHPLHFEHVQTAIRCSRNVLVEKPATMNAKQYQVLADLALRQNVVLMEAMWTRYLPAVRHLKETLLPKIGEVKRVFADFSFPIVSPDLPHSSRFLDKKAGAGSLLDQGVYALTWVDLALNGLGAVATDTKVIHANSMSVPGVAGEVDDIDTLVLAQTDKSNGHQTAVAVATTSMTLPGSSKPPFYQRLQAKKAAPSIRIEATKASVAIPFPPIRPQELHVQWYGEEHLDDEGVEIEEVVKLPVERGWGIWYQADVIARRVAARKPGERGEVIGLDESLRVLQWMDDARRLAGIDYDAQLDLI